MFNFLRALLESRPRVSFEADEILGSVQYFVRVTNPSKYPIEIQSIRMWLPRNWPFLAEIVKEDQSFWMTRPTLAKGKSMGPSIQLNGLIGTDKSVTIGLMLPEEVPCCLLITVHWNRRTGIAWWKFPLAIYRARTELNRLQKQAMQDD
jgi:hypothetical protein